MLSCEAEAFVEKQRYNEQDLMHNLIIYLCVDQRNL